MAMHPHEVEELEMQFGARLWDATPGVCCAAFQTGACNHTEAYDDADYDADRDEALFAGWLMHGPPAPRPFDDAPF